MIDENLLHAIPTRLDDPEKFLFFDFDVFAVFILLFSFAIMVGHPFIGGGVAVLLTILYSKFKAGKHPKFLQHWLYWYFGFAPKNVPPSNVRELIR
jgi:conjugal transfer pilus assembly protein TraL